MSDNKKNKLSIIIAQSIKELDNTRRDILSFLVLNQIDDELISRIELSVYEVLINVIDHAPEEYRDKEISINCIITDKTVEIKISNYGEEFDIRNPDLPNIDEHAAAGKRRGLGLYMIRTLMDDIKYSFADHVNTLLLIVNRK